MGESMRLGRMEGRKDEKDSMPSWFGDTGGCVQVLERGLQQSQS